MQKNTILSELESMRRRMDRLYAEIVEEQSLAQSETMREEVSWTPQADQHETEAELFIDVDLPGVAESELQVEIIEGRLVVSGRRRIHFREGRAVNYSQKERPDGVFTRSFDLPSQISQEGIKADLNAGVLTITIPKSNNVQPSALKIKVQEGE